MARLTAPLLSLGASGSIAKALVFASWKGIPYARVHVIPTNPNTVAQQDIRGIFQTLNEMWKRMPQRARNPWLYAVRGLALTDRNKHISLNVPALQGEATLDELVMSVATGSALPLDNVVTADGADGTITITADEPLEPPQYRILAARAIAVLDGDPSPVIIRPTYYATDETPPFSIVIDVPADGDYQVGVWGLYRNDADGLNYCGTADRTQVAVTGN